MSNNKSKLDNGAAGLRVVADIITVIAVFGFAWALIFAIIGNVSWGSFGCYAALCFGAIVVRYIMVALATVAEAASCYIEKTKTN